MWQRWTDLLFLHWKVAPEEVRKTLPPGLTVDVFDGAAWVGIVPFYMKDVRPAGVPALPWISHFLELNVRTYVRDEAGRPGVWFYSLDCNRGPAVELARRAFKLSYQHARMASQRQPGGWIDYQCRRLPGRWQKAELPPGEARFRYRPAGEIRTAAPDSLDCFLTERYRLFAWDAAKRQLHTGEVWHEPYPLQEAEVEAWSTLPAAWNQTVALEGPPVTRHFSPGVEVGVFPLRKAG